MKVCFVASSGGHWEELMCLSDIFNKYDSFFVTEEGGQADEMKGRNIYTFPQINRREKGFLLHFIKMSLAARKILNFEKPDVVISTGALISVPFCYLAKIKGAKIIYIESFARVNEGSLTGKLMNPIADLFLVQWKSLLKVYPNATYIGGLF